MCSLFSGCLASPSRVCWCLSFAGPPRMRAAISDLCACRMFLHVLRASSSSFITWSLMRTTDAISGVTPRHSLRKSISQSASSNTPKIPGKSTGIVHGRQRRRILQHAAGLLGPPAIHLRRRRPDQCSPITASLWPLARQSDLHERDSPCHLAQQAGSEPSATTICTRSMASRWTRATRPQASPSAPPAEGYHWAKWVGIFVVAPLLWFLLFIVYDSLVGDVRASPWGLLVVARLSSHRA